MPSWGGLPRVTLLVCIMRSVHAGGNTCESTDGNGQQCGGTASVLKDAHQYCIIGAGPGGLQLGQQFLRQGVDYVTLEREARPGAFFETFPRHRTLISINKRFTGRADREFNLRHDWNSLLDNEEAVPVTNRTASRWPHADVLVGYLRDYARAQERAGRIAYERTVSRLTKQGDGAFSMDLADKDGAVSRLRCQYVVVATGLFKPNRPGDIPGLNLTMDYADLPEQSSSFEGKTVAVLGAGNAGFEVANDMAPYVNYVHVFAGRGVTQENELLSFESRYVGNVRAINAALLDSYLLKSLDGGLSPSFPARIMSIFECGPGGKKRCMFPKHHDDPTFVSIGTFSRTDDEAVEFVTGVRHHVKLERVSWGPTVLQVDMRRRHEELPKNYLVQNEQYQVYLNTSYLGAATMDAVLEFARKSGTPFPLEYDVIVSCLGTPPAGPSPARRVCCASLLSPCLAPLLVAGHRLRRKQLFRPCGSSAVNPHLRGWWDAFLPQQLTLPLPLPLALPRSTLQVGLWTWTCLATPRARGCSPAASSPWSTNDTSPSTCPVCSLPALSRTARTTSDLPVASFTVSATRHAHWPESLGRSTVEFLGRVRPGSAASTLGRTMTGSIPAGRRRPQAPASARY